MPLPLSFFFFVLFWFVKQKLKQKKKQKEDKKEDKKIKDKEIIFF